MKKKILSHISVSILLSFSLCLLMCACVKNSTVNDSEGNSHSSYISEETADNTVHSSVLNSKKTESKESYDGVLSSAVSSKSESSQSSVSSEYIDSLASVLSVISHTSSTEININTSKNEEVIYNESTANTQITEETDNNTEYRNNDTQEDTYYEPEDTYDNEDDNETHEDTKPDRTLPDKGDREKKIIVIDAVHQQYPNFDVEPIAPGSYEMKVKVTGGTTGVVTGIPEYELTLTLALKLQTILEERGYEVVQTRTTNDVDISNIERAEVANSINADAFIRIHANGSDYSSVNGAMTLCQTPYNPDNGHIYPECYSLSKNVLDELVSATGCNKQFIWETDTMCGINWSLVPVTIVEVGYMSNPQEDLLMATDDYQNKICAGLANGIDKFFEEQEQE